MNLLSWMSPADLAPGDQKSLQRDWSDITLHTITDSGGSLFKMAYEALWTEFGALGEMEHQEVLAARMQWDAMQPSSDCSLCYRLMLVVSNGRFAAARDHTAIILSGVPGVIVHLSHNLVAPEWRRTGLAGWLRALPVTTARDLLVSRGYPADAPMTLVGEMQHLDASHPTSLIRLTAYEKAGYKKIDPSRVNYLQPDFRAVAKCRSASQPIPLALIVRRVGHEQDDFITGAEVQRIISSLYKMYRMGGCLPQDMATVEVSSSFHPAPEEKICLIPPTSP